MKVPSGLREMGRVGVKGRGSSGGNWREKQGLLAQNRRDRPRCVAGPGEEVAEDALGGKDKGHEILEQVRLVLQRRLVWPRGGAPPLRLRGHASSIFIS